jgi:2,4-dienoyl-CoA reductase-like NADH-dependent reductase (Old Yellow Enzyme family)
LLVIFVRSPPDLGGNLADAAAFGGLFIANSDLPNRFRLNAPLYPPNESPFYGGAEKGYPDYPMPGPWFVQR